MAARQAPGHRSGIVTHTRNPVRRAFHILISLLGWGFFAWVWTDVFLRPLDRSAVPTLVLLLAVLAGIIVLNLLWVQYNIGIYRTHGRRTRVRRVEFAGSTDHLGRTLEGADWRSLRETGWIRIDLDEAGRRKLYRDGSPAGLEKD